MDDRFLLLLKTDLYSKSIPMKKILVPTDFSVPATQALQFAALTAQISSGSIHLMHVVDLPIIQDSFLTPTIYVDDSIVKDSVAKAEKSFTRAIEKYKNIKITTSVEYGNTTMATIPITFDEAVLQGKVKRGDLVAFVAFGAGFTWGANLLRY